MKKIFAILTLSVFVVAACSTDKTAQLKKLKAERDQISAQIAQLEKELGDTGEKVVQEKKTYVEVAQIQPQVFQHFIDVKGTVVSDNNVMVPAQRDGLVLSVKVKEGQSVKKGQLLAKLDDSPIRSQMMPYTKQLELAKTVYERQKRLWEKEIGSEIDYLAAKTNKEALEETVAAYELEISKTSIYSSLNGIVDEIMMKEGEMAGAGKSGIRIVGTGNLKIKANLSEMYYGSVKKGDNTIVKVPSQNVDFEKPIFAVEKAINPANRTFGIDVRPPHNVKLSPNMLTVVTVNDYTKEEAIVVPQNIVQTDNKGSFLFIVQKKDGQSVAVKRDVLTGKSYKGKVEILQGLSAGDQLITSGYQNVSNGQKVTLQ
jgi:membrane fusion protein (multidrug efflux system)